MKEISMKNGMSVMVDDADFPVLIKYKWHAGKNSTNWYAYTTLWVNKKRVNIPMHRAILNITDRSLLVDHKDGNGLNNQRHNIRLSTHQQNSCNQRKPSKSNRAKTSIFKGVCFKKAQGKFYASIDSGNIKIHLGVYSTEEEAAIAYNIATTKYHGEFARLNNI